MSQTTREIIITRIFGAPRAELWRAWTVPERFQCWWGPKSFTIPFCQMDLRVGGNYLNCMCSPDGEFFWGTGTYLEVVEKERLMFTDCFADSDGNIVPASTYGKQGEWPADAKITVTFEDLGDSTRLSLKYTSVPSGIDGDLTEQALNESLDRLSDCLK